MNIFDGIKAQLDALASHASAQLKNQNLADILKSAAAKVQQASQHADAAIFEPLQSDLEGFFKMTNALAGNPGSPQHPFPSLPGQNSQEGSG